MRGMGRKPKGENEVLRTYREMDPATSMKGTLAFKASAASVAEVGKKYLQRAAPTFAAAIELYKLELSGQFGAADQVRLSAIVDLEAVRRRCIRQLREKGVLIEVVGKDKDGNVSVTLKDNPLLFHLIRIHETLGYTAQDMLFSKKARTGAQKDTAAAALDLERRSRLRSAKSPKLPPMGQTRAIDIRPEPRSTDVVVNQHPS